jgi:hypothetical protein
MQQDLLKPLQPADQENFKGGGDPFGLLVLPVVALVETLLAIPAVAALHDRRITERTRDIWSGIVGEEDASAAMGLKPRRRAAQ